jgi:pantoate--beta-alanine ligase
VKTVNDIIALRLAAKLLRNGGKSIALVPTMGALHDGHLALVKAAQERADHVAVSIFVNPTQFGAGEDLAAYPRQLARDQQLLEEAGAALLWAPDVAAMYPNGFQTVITTPNAAKGLCGEKRPGHFDGVATIVCKLLNQIQPDIALFGEKDYQQLAVIKTMVRDLDMPVAIEGVPTVREADGLAMSSRNAYLTVDQRAAATTLPNAMMAAIADIESGGIVDAALAQLQSALSVAGFHTIDYAEIRMADTLAEPDYDALKAGANLRLLAAAHIGKTRLIDNMPLLWRGG